MNTSPHQDNTPPDDNDRNAHDNRRTSREGGPFRVIKEAFVMFPTVPILLAVGVAVIIFLILR